MVARCFWKMKTLPVEAEEEVVAGSVRVQRGQPTARVFPDKPIVAPNVSPSVCECVLVLVFIWTSRYLCLYGPRNAFCFSAAKYAN